MNRDQRRLKCHFPVRVGGHCLHSRELIRPEIASEFIRLEIIEQIRESG